MAQQRPRASRRRSRQAHRRGSRLSRIDWQLWLSVFKPLAFAAVLLLVGFSGWRSYHWLMLPTTLPLLHVEVKGNLLRVDPKVLEEKIRHSVTSGFFSTDLAAVKQRLLAIPWVYDVSLRRVWPDRLEVAIEEQQPIARWGDEGLLNRYGEVFKASLDSRSIVLPVISGGKGREHELIQAFVSADEVLNPLDLRLIELREDPRGDQRLLLSSGVELALGRQQHEARLSRFAAAYRRTLAQVIDRISVLDLRYANGFSVRWRHERSKFTKTSDGRV
ncbi:MAG TPA: FtsQ-type POTRA domain-containing protein [Gammaproteobacteria bacterium]|nr:FtsQ-type POTRA domain-containing protein [Gammaproteobacteria bacterium]